MITAGRAREHSNHHDEDHFIVNLVGIGRHSEDILREYGFANTWSFSFKGAAPGAA